MGFGNLAQAQNDVMMQAFYWNVPVDDVNLNGTWYDSLKAHAAGLKQAGLTAIWTPPPSKGAFSIYDMGYGIYDHYDLGEYSQKGNVGSGIPASTETRFGSKQELINMINEFHNKGMEVYADIVLNHLYGGSYETNAPVKNYIEEENYPSYPTSQVRWVLPNAAAGDYYIQLNGFNLNWSSFPSRGYELRISWGASDNNDAGPGDNPVWESEPNGGGGQFNTFPASGRAVYGHADTQGDVDEFKVTLSSTATITIQLIPKYDNSGTMQWASDDNGYRIRAAWYNGQNQYSSLQLRALTSFSYATHSGGAPQWTWSYPSFHLVDNADYLQDQGSEDAVRPNWMLFGVDFNTYDSGTVQPRLKTWGQWLTNTAGFDGYRLDFVRGIQEAFVADWLKAMPLKSGAQRFAVGEYWTTYKYRLRDWVNAISSNGAASSVFDFPLRDDLKRMCNNESGFQMSWLNHSGLIRDQSTPVAANRVVTFLENHDTGKEHDKWITQDRSMGYAFILFAQGRPCIFYPHYYGVQQKDGGDPNITTGPEAGLQTKLNKLLSIRNRYLGGGMEVLTEIGNPYPSSSTANVFIARREGDHNSKPGAILVLNNHNSSEQSAWVTVNVSGWPTLTNQTLKNLTSGQGQTVTVQGDGRVSLSAPARGYAIWAIDTTYVPIDFTVNNAYTSWGQNVYLVGSIAALGSWDTNKALGPLDASSYPTWKIFDVYLPPSTSIQYKYIKKDGSGNVTWESGNNHTYTTPANGGGSVNDNWGAGKASEQETIEEQKLPEVYSLAQNYPNPFSNGARSPALSGGNPETTIAYDIPAGQSVAVQLVIYNTLGQAVRQLVETVQAPGSYRVRWDGRNEAGVRLASGVYLYRLQAGPFIAEKKLVLMQ
jgi:alpha-amylase